MIEIKHKTTGKVLHTVDADTLQGADLSGADLADAKLVGVDFSQANLSGSLLSGADLRKVDFTETVIDNADLAGANLNRANFNDACLRSSNLQETNLQLTNFQFVDLTKADFTNAILMETTFLDCVALHEVTGLSDVVHLAPSILDTRTLRASIEHLPDVFLRGVGMHDEEISYLRALYSGPKAIQFYSCFISHAATKRDGAFADRLRNDLLARNVSCWHFRYDLKMGDRWASQIESAIKTHDKLVVVCSEEGILREGVVREIIHAVEQEQKSGVQKLFSVRLDDFIFSPKMRDGFDRLPPHLKRADWLDYLLEYQIGDFARWKSPDAYEAQFAALLQALKNPAPR